MKEGSRRAIIAALLANLGIAVAKLIGFLFTGAASMLAEAVRSLADTGNQGLLFLGGARARRHPTPEHPFGFGHERYFWGFIVALVLFSMGSLFAIVEGVEKLLHPHELESPMWAIVILALAVVLEGWSFRTAVREARPLKGDDTWWGFIRHSKTPEITVVLLEDTGALLGLGFALVCVGLAVLTGEPRFDAGGSIAIGLLLGAIALVLAKEMKSLLIGEAAGEREVAIIRRTIEQAPAVRRLIHLRTLHLGPEELLVAAKVELDPALSFVQISLAIDQTEALVRAEVAYARVIYLEPDVFQPPAASVSLPRRGPPAPSLH